MKISDFGYRDFTFREFACSCCGRLTLHERVIALCQSIRDHVAEPLIVTSGYRCQIHNQAVGGSPRSQHVEGRAADLALASGVSRRNDRTDRLVGAVRRMAPYGYGLYFGVHGLDLRFVHVDVRAGTIARWAYWGDKRVELDRAIAVWYGGPDGSARLDAPRGLPALPKDRA